MSEEAKKNIKKMYAGKYVRIEKGLNLCTMCVEAKFRKLSIVESNVRITDFRK